LSAAKTLMEAGFKQVSFLRGGMENWNKAGNAVEAN
jgi:rhodanese-related sulfurtransferase